MLPKRSSSGKKTKSYCEMFLRLLLPTPIPNQIPIPTTASTTPVWNKETGEPNQRYIMGVDIGVLYRNVGKIDSESDVYKYIPNVTKDYFRKYPNKEMPKKFKKQSKKKKED